MQSIGQTSMHPLSFTPMHGSTITYVIALTCLLVNRGGLFISPQPRQPSTHRAPRSLGGPMQLLMLQVPVFHLAAGDIAGHRHRGVVVVQPLHMAPGPLPPKKIVDPEQRLDVERSQRYRGPLQDPYSQGM